MNGTDASARTWRSSEFPYPDDWYNDPKMLAMENPSELWLKAAIHKRDLPSARWSLRTGLKAWSMRSNTQSRCFQRWQGGEQASSTAIEDLSR